MTTPIDSVLWLTAAWGTHGDFNFKSQYSHLWKIKSTFITLSLFQNKMKHNINSYYIKPPLLKKNKKKISLYKSIYVYYFEIVSTEVFINKS